MNTIATSHVAPPPSQAGTVKDHLASVSARMAAKIAAHWDRVNTELFHAPVSISCPVHPDMRLVVDRQKTFSDSWGEDGVAIAHSSCSACVHEAAAAASRRIWTASGVPRNLLAATLDNFDLEEKTKRAEALQTCLNFVSGRRGFLILVGPVGVGKSHLAVSVLKSYGNGCFITHPELLMQLRATYKVGGTEKFVRRLERTRCLVIDELGVSSGGADEEPVFYQILSTRYGEGLPTVLTSNGDVATISSTLGPRLMDRIAEDYCVVALTGASYRRKRLI